MKPHSRNWSHLISCLDNEPVEFDWLVDTTEKWCKERAVYLALLESINIADGGDDKRTPDIPSILSDALLLVSIIMLVTIT